MQQESIPHGTRYAYERLHCSCDKCKEANAIYKSETRARNARIRASERAKGIDQNPNLVHGKAVTHVWHGCQCKQCIEAARKVWREEKRLVRLFRIGA